MSESKALLQVRDLTKRFPVKTGFFSRAKEISALDGISFDLERGKTLAIVGESGCGKSTLAKCLMLIEEASSGVMILDGRSQAETPPAEWRKQVQMIFQDPYSSLNPRKVALDIIAEPLIIAGEVSRAEARERALEMMAKVGLRPEYAARYPHMFSGGQRQRIGIARALMLKPRVLICDEPVSALDISIQAQVLNLLLDLQDEFGLSYLFISHDLSVVRHIADEVLVMYLGRVMEKGPREKIFLSPQHPYTQALLASHPDLSHGVSGIRAPVAALKGDLPSPLLLPTGCPFETRCPSALAICREKRPEPMLRQSRELACHLPPHLPIDTRSV